ncbi:hypothetical protein YTPLAS18_24000 [Nitrospira sp.]|nr:hypothetical protein YTPLAS18_24000 [Nitrospira sp.]
MSPSALSFSAQGGTVTPSYQTLTITNSGGGSLSWTASDPSSWLLKNTQSGSGNGSVNVWIDPTGMAAGTYTSSVTIAASGAANTPRVIPVTLTIAAAPQPTIGLSPTSLSFSGTQGSTNPANQSITVSNTGSGTLTWSVSDNAGWLTATQSGSSILASVNLTGLGAGTYSAAITVTATGATNTPRTIPVTLTVTAAPQPTIGLSPTSLSFSGTQGATNPTNQSIVVSNTGSGTLTWSVSDNAAWLTATQSGNSIVASTNLTGLGAGTYTAAITVVATGATNTPQTIPVTLVVGAPAAQPTIGLSPSALSFSGTAGGSNPSNQTIAVSNTGTGSLTWSVSDNQSWLTATQSGNSIVSGVNISGLSAGNYSGTITVVASGATNTPQTIPVNLTISAAPAPSPTISVSPTSFSYTVDASTAYSASQTLNISNTGGGTLNWVATDPVDWLQKNTGSGTGNGSVNMWIVPSGLSAGTYTTTVTVSASGATNPVVTVPVTVTITAPAPTPTIGLSPTSLSFSATTSGSNPGSQSIGVSNVGTGTLTWSVTDNASWLTATQSGNTIVASVNKSGLAAGTYNAMITVTASGATNTPRTIPVSLTLSAGTVNQSASLTWSANGESDLAGYKVYRATASGAYGAPIAVIQGNITSYTATGLQAGTTYFFVVTAYDNTGNESGWSNEVSKSIF